MRAGATPMTPEHHPPVDRAGVAAPDYTGGLPGPDMYDDDPATLARRLTELRLEHRDLDAAIARLASGPLEDELQLTRLKKRKLKLKDMIAWLENKLIPDLDA